MLRLGAYHDLIKRFLCKASTKQAKQYNLNRVESNFKVGDLVLRKDHPLSDAGKYFSAKLAKTFSGPYKIVRQLSKNVFELDLPTKQQSPKTHVRFLKKYVSVADSCTAMAERHNDSHSSDEEEDPYYPPIPRGCFNCAQEHNHRDCPYPRTFSYCYICGWLGHTKFTCPRPSCRAGFKSSWIWSRMESNGDVPSKVSRRSSPVPPGKTSPSAPLRDPDLQQLDNLLAVPGPSSRQPNLDASAQMPPPPRTSRHTFTASALSLDPADLELLRILRNFFSVRGYSLSSSASVEVSALLSPQDHLTGSEPLQLMAPNDPEEDLIDLHPTADDVDELDAVVEEADATEDSLEGDFDIQEEVERFVERGTFPS